MDSRLCPQKYNNQSKHVSPTNTKEIADNLITYLKKHFSTSNVFIGFRSGICKAHIVSPCDSYRRINRSMKSFGSRPQFTTRPLKTNRCLRNEFIFSLQKIPLTNFNKSVRLPELIEVLDVAEDRKCMFQDS